MRASRPGVVLTAIAVAMSMVLVLNTGADASSQGRESGSAPREICVPLPGAPCLPTPPTPPPPDPCQIVPGSCSGPTPSVTATPTPPDICSAVPGLCPTASPTASATPTSTAAGGTSGGGSGTTGTGTGTTTTSSGTGTTTTGTGTGTTGTGTGTTATGTSASKNTNFRGLITKVSVARSRRSASVRVLCPEGTPGCVIALQNAAAASTTKKAKWLALMPGTSKTVTFKLSPATARKLKRRGGRIYFTASTLGSSLEPTTRSATVKKPKKRR